MSASSEQTSSVINSEVEYTLPLNPRRARFSYMNVQSSEILLLTHSFVEFCSLFQEGDFQLAFQLLTCHTN